MALILFAAAAAENDRIEKEKNQVRGLEKYLGKKIPNFLVEGYYYTYTVSDEIKKLFVSIEHMNESEKAVAVKGVLQILISKYEKQQKDRYEEERGWDSRLTKAPRTIRGADFSYKVKLLNEESAKELQKLFLNNGEVIKNVNNGSELPQSTEEISKYIESINSLFKSNKAYSYGVFSDYNLVGEISLVQLTGYAKKIYEMGFRIGKKYSDKGIIGKAGKLVKKIAFEDLGADFIVINTEKTNAATNAVAKKLGFVLEQENMNNEDSQNTRSKSSQGAMRNFFTGEKHISDLKEKKYSNI